MMITNKRISLVDTVTQSNGNIVSDMDGEKVLLSIRNSKYYNLGAVGGKIWELLDTPIPVKLLVNKLISEFEVEQTECEEEVISFLDTLLDEGLVELQKT